MKETIESFCLDSLKSTYIIHLISLACISDDVFLWLICHRDS